MNLIAMAMATIGMAGLWLLRLRRFVHQRRKTLLLRAGVGVVLIDLDAVGLVDGRIEMLEHFPVIFKVVLLRKDVNELRLHVGRLACNGASMTNYITHEARDVCR